MLVRKFRCPLVSSPWQDKAPDARIMNLETAVTTNAQPWPQKGINYRTHPGGWEWA